MGHVLRVFAVLLAEVAGKFGWFLLLVGLIPPAMSGLDHLTSEPAVARVTAVVDVCRQTSDNRRVACPAEGAATAGLTRKRHVQLSFSLADGRSVTAAPLIGKLERSAVTDGELIPILYRRRDHYVAPRHRLWFPLLGVAVSVAGLLLLMGRRYALRSADAPVAPGRAPAPVAPPQRATRIGVVRSAGAASAVRRPVDQRQRGLFG